MLLHILIMQKEGKQLQLNSKLLHSQSGPNNSIFSFVNTNLTVWRCVILTAQLLLPVLRFKLCAAIVSLGEREREI